MGGEMEDGGHGLGVIAVVLAVWRAELEGRLFGFEQSGSQVVKW